MATKKMKTPGAPAASRTRRSPLAPQAGNPAPSGLPFDDASSKVLKGQLRPKGGPRGGQDPATATRRSQRQTTAGAQFRISFALPGPQAPEAQSTLANGRPMSSVMGRQRPNFAGGLRG